MLYNSFSFCNAFVELYLQVIFKFYFTATKIIFFCTANVLLDLQSLIFYLGNEELTELFREMETEEESRNLEKNLCIKVEKSLLKKRVHDTSFEFPDNQLDTDCDSIIARVHEQSLKGIPSVKGETIDSPSIMEEDDDGDDWVETDFEQTRDMSSMVGRDISLQCSENITTMRNNDSQHSMKTLEQTQQIQTLEQTQQIQQSLSVLHKKDSVTKDKVVVELVREGLKIAEDDDELFFNFRQQLEEVNNNMTKLAAARKNNVLNNNVDTTEGTHFSQSGKHTRQTKRRKGVTDF